MTDPLIEFLNARYDEIEQAAYRLAGGTWSARYDEVFVQHDPMPDEPIIYACRPDVAEWIAARDPRTTQRDIAAKRKIVAMADGQPGYHLPDGVKDDRSTEERKCDDVLKLTLFEVLRNLAEEFATHPDYKAKDWGQWPTP